MIINSQFFITYYTGKNPLKLTTVPEGLSITQLADYNKFIQSVGTIYSSQTLNGKIPKFWTQLTEVTDALGNKKYSYIPHPDCDLTELSSKSAYYFIVRDDSALPLRIPAISGSLLGFTDTSSLPIIVKSSIPNTQLNNTTGHTFILSPVFGNLQPFEEYKYEFKSVDANWPVSINPVSGIIKPATDTSTINTKILFCPNSGECDSNVLDYELDTSCLEDNNPYITMQLAITPISYEGPEVISDHITTFCSDCLPIPSISIESTDPLLLTNLSSDSPASEYQKYNFSLKVDKLKPNHNYFYSIEAIDAEWPTFFVGKTSGVINTSKSNVNFPLITPGSGQLVFCESTGLCPNGSSNINTYNIPAYPEFWNAPASYSVTLRALLRCDDCLSETVYSKPVMVSFCKNCLPEPKISINQFDQNNLIVKNNDRNFLFGLSVQNLQKYQTYNYSVDVIRSEWPTFFIGKTSGTIETNSDTDFPIFSKVLNKLVFCESTGLCPSNSAAINDYVVPEYNNLWTGSGTYDAVLRASLDCVSSPADTIYSEPVVVSFCTNCLEDQSVAISTTGPTSLDKTTPNFSFGIDFSGLRKDATYNYSIDVIKSEWPTFFVGKTSGTLDIDQDTLEPIAPIFGKLIFCKSTEICPSGAESINDYAVPEYPDLWTGSGTYDVVLRATLNRTSPPLSTTHSNLVVISYETEIPKQTIPDITLSLDDK
jgi:hypothetical protein